MIIKKILKIGMFSTIISISFCHADTISESFKFNVHKSNSLNNIPEPVEIPKPIEEAYPTIKAMPIPQLKNSVTPTSLTPPTTEKTTVQKQELIELPSAKTTVQKQELIELPSAKTTVTKQELIELPSAKTTVTKQELIELPSAKTTVTKQELIVLPSSKLNNATETITPEKITTKVDITAPATTTNTTNEISKLAKQEQEVWQKLKGKTIDDPEYLDLVTELNNIGIKRNAIIKSANIDPKTITPVIPPKAEANPEIKFTQNKIPATPEIKTNQATTGNVIYSNLDMFNEQKPTKKSKSNTKSKNTQTIEKPLPVNDQSIMPNAIVLPIKIQ